MEQIRIFDEGGNRTLIMELESNNRLNKSYLKMYFPSATGLYYHGDDRNEIIV